MPSADLSRHARARMGRAGFAALLLLLLISFAVMAATPASHPASVSPVRFTEVTREAGIGFVHSFGDRHLSNLIEATGSGAAWLDYNRDGNVDLYLATGKFHDRLSEGERPRTVQK